MIPPIAILGNLGWVEMVVILVIAALLFGRRIPEVAGALGKSIVELKKGLADKPEDDDPKNNDVSPR